jgi:hypothetical protein
MSGSGQATLGRWPCPSPKSHPPDLAAIRDPRLAARRRSNSTTALPAWRRCVSQLAAAIMARSNGRGDLCRSPDVSMVQATDFANWHHVSKLRWLDRPFVRRILGEGEVGPGAVVVLEVSGEDVSPVALAQDEDMVETLSANRADQAFREGILPRASGSREDFLDLHAPHTLAEGVPVDGVSIAEEIGRGGVVGESVHDLLGGPRAVGCSVTLKCRTRRRW